MKAKRNTIFKSFLPLSITKSFLKTGFLNDSSYIATAKFGRYKILLNEDKNYDSLYLSIYHNHKLTFKKKIPGLQLPLTLCDTLYIADINGDKLPDFKIVVYNNGSGLAASLVNKIYLFQKCRHRFNDLKYIDFSDFPEYYLNQDGNYEIIGKVLTHYGGHSYWTFNLFNYVAGQWKNVNYIAKYPLMVQYLDKENYKITNKISRRTMKQFSLKEPDYFKTRGIKQ